MKSILDQIFHIKTGLTTNEVADIISSLDITEKRLASVVGPSTSTLAIRKKNGRFKSIESERIMRVNRIFTRAMEVFNQDKNIAKRWIKSPAKALGNIAPIDFTDTDIGAREVENLLGRIEYGVYS